jgi:AcrR family transcriptional regulator
MSPKPKWTRRSADRPTELAKAALALCAERGVQATRVADVAARAGVTVGTVYRYFRDKESLIEAAMKQPASPARRFAVPDRPGASLPALADAIRRWGLFFRDSGLSAVRVALSDPRRDASTSDGALREATTELSSIVAHGVDKKEMRADLDADAVAHALIGALLLAPMFSGGKTTDAHAEAVSALAVRGLRADGPSWRA